MDNLDDGRPLKERIESKIIESGFTGYRFHSIVDDAKSSAYLPEGMVLRENDVRKVINEVIEECALLCEANIVSLEHPKLEPVDTLEQIDYSCHTFDANEIRKIKLEITE